MRHGQYGTNFRSPRVDVHRFSMIPRADIPRSSFRMQNQHKTTISASYLVPIYLQEVLPGDTFNVNMSAFVRLSTPLFPILDNLELESFFFFVPNRLVWTNWYRFMGEQDNPTASIAFTIPQVVSPAGGFPQFSVYDYFGLPTVGQVASGNTVSVSALPLRAYALIYNQWFRDENLEYSIETGSGPGYGYCSMDDGPDVYSLYNLQPAQKRHDYFTSCLPWTQKGNTPVSIPLSGNALVKTNGSDTWTGVGNNPLRMLEVSSGGAPPPGAALGFNTTSPTQEVASGTQTISGAGFLYYPSNLYADLSTATSTTINALRLAFQTQKLLERDARGGTRYTEIIRSHFGVLSPDSRLMRPEYLGGGRSPVNVAPVPQTTATGITGGSSPLGTLSAVGTAVMRPHGFRYSATEHGHIIGLVVCRRDQIYQQGIRRLWKRNTRYDFYFPVFATLGEQSVYNYEIYSDGSANDALTFGYQERWAEYRYHPSYTSGYFRSTTSGTLDSWHLAEKFAALPTLSSTFIADETDVVLQRVLAAGSQANNQQLLCDFFFDERVARPMPLYSVPGLIDHF